ncbi:MULTISPECIES: two-component system sensor histidine kinase ZraS [unclassified Serratia (in: enterobacteria)]|uniref:two-component system sensor histidine kinase ZraS n=1 Tax=unclassified Serratia (in: enterobacteria) TaxID=2647522 RepID=UPI0005037472|nr:MULTISPECIES: two-component system sensor histidine kinase ZraS [unclassified Serratia (in: enterobacteria)]KFK92183.1 sensor protein ZraS [Serratia sp. Ag2]KFK97144.1 sensor protein ZraS [Serratia sp. Ag1]
MKKKSGISSALLAWIVIGPVVIVLGIIITLAVKDLQSGRAIEIQTLRDKSAVLIRAFESGTRTGMGMGMGMRWRQDQRQILLEEMAYQPGVLYIAMTDPSGRILAHSDPMRVGSQLYSKQQMDALQATGVEQWHMTSFVDQQHNSQNTFEAYRFFKPLKRANGHGSHMMNMHRAAETDAKGSESDEQLLIFVAFDTQALDAAQAKDIRNTSILLTILLLLVLSSLLTLFWARRYQRSSRQLQDEIRRKEKLAAIGDLAAGLAHEIRNPLSSIKGFAKYFEGRSLPGSEEQELAKVMAKEVERLNRVISELLALVRPVDLHIQQVDINEVLEHSLHLIRQDAESKNITIRYCRNQALPLAELDPDRLTQALLNLYLNAIQAIGSDGLLEVSVVLVGGEGLRISVTDSGKGIKPDDLAKIFNPYFTTKAAGTGLGLTIVQKVIEEHQGSISVSNHAPSGCRFEMTIPLIHKKREAPEDGDA